MPPTTAVSRAGTGRRGRIAGGIAGLNHQIYERIHQAIIEQRIPPGTKLGEEQLSAVFGVSRARIRQVLLRLSHSGAVELRPNHGAYVTQPTASEAREVFTARRIIEAHIVSCVSRSLTEQQRRALARHVAHERAAHQRNARTEAIRLSGEFHLLLARVCGNEVLAQFLRDLVSRTSLIIAVYGGPGLSLCAYGEHEALLAELAAGNENEAVQQMSRHLERIEAQLDLDRVPGKSVDLGQTFAEMGAR